VIKVSYINSGNIALKQLVNTKPKRSKYPPSIPTSLKLLRTGFTISGHLSPSLTARLAYKLWFTPTRFKTPARELTVLQSAETSVHRINEHDISTYSWGFDDMQKPLLLLVHGWSGRGTQLGSFVQPLLDAGYRVLSFDLPAHGKSSGKNTNLYEVAKVIKTLPDIFGSIEAVISHSFGGPCLTTAMQNGFTTNRAVCISPPATTKGLVVKFNQALHIPEKAMQKMIRLIERNFGKNIWHEVSMVNSVENIDIPGLLIHDKDDRDIPYQEGQAVAQAWNNAPFIKTSGLGHRRILRDDEVIDQAITFLKQ